jgi:hypothetical protein
MDTALIVNAAILALGFSLVLVAIVLSLFESRYRAIMEKKDRTSALLTEQIRMATEHDEAVKVAASVHGDAPEPQRQALALCAGSPRLLETFLRLTDRLGMGVQGDPLEEPIQWEGRGRPSYEDIETIAAVRVLQDIEYVGGVFPAGYGEYVIVATNEAMAVRAALDRLPESLKAKVRQEQLRPVSGE